MTDRFNSAKLGPRAQGHDQRTYGYGIVPTCTPVGFKISEFREVSNSNIVGRKMCA